MEIVLIMVLIILIGSGAIGSWQFFVGLVVAAILFCVGLDIAMKNK